MKFINLFALVVMFVMGMTAETQAQCSAAFTWNSTPNGVSFNATSTGLQQWASYSWDFGDNSTGWGMNTSHAYNQPGTYVVCLTVTDSLCTITYCDSIVVSGGTGNPCANAGVGFQYTTAPGGTSFISSVSGFNSGVTYNWSFPNSSSTQANPTVQLSAGWHSVCLTVTDSICTETYCDSVYVQGTGNPCANAGVGFQYTTGPLGTSFVSSVSGFNGGVTYSWSFPNSSSTQANPTVQLSNGWHSVCLTVTDSICTETYCDSVYVQGTGGNPCANASVGYQYSSNALGTTFYPYTNGLNQQGTVYTWTFPNGNSSQNNPTVQLNAGWHYVCVTATDSICTVTYCDSVYVQGNSNPCAGFTASASSSVSGNTVNFTSTVNGGTAPYSYSWTFGDGNSSTQANPTHTYANGGAYSPTLSVVDANGCTVNYTDSLWINGGTGGNCQHNEVILSLTFDNWATETSWDVRDAGGNIVASGSGYTPNNNGTTLTQVLCLPTGCYDFNIYDSYGDGICCLYGQGHYSLVDNATNAVLASSNGAFGFVETQNICVGGATNPCTGFNTSFQSVTSNNSVTFTATSTSNLPGGVQYVWNFGDNTTGTGANPTHTYTNVPGTGAYIVCVTAYDTMGCTATYCDSVAVLPAPCNNNMVTLALNFDNFASETTWNLTDASGNIVQSGSGYTQNDNGTTQYFNFCLPTGCYDFNIYDSFGDGICCAWGQGSYNLIDANGVVLASGGSFGHSDHRNICVGGASNPCGNFFGSIASTSTGNGTVNFTSNFSIQQPLNYSWDFGDGNTSNQANPTHTYTQNGVYVVCLTADSAGCTVTYCDSILVTGAGNNNNPCAGLSLNMNITQDSTNPFVLWMQPVVNNAPAGSNFSFVWDFGDNTGAFSGSPSHAYNNYGSYSVCIMAIDTVYGCSATFCDTITIDSNGNFSRNPNYKDVKPGFLVNTLPPVINQVTSVGVIENDNFNMSLFPNPASKEVNLAITAKEAMDGTVSILDIAGKTVYNNNVNLNEGQQQLTLSVDNLPAGVYLVRMTSDAAQTTMKFIKE